MLPLVDGWHLCCSAHHQPLVTASALAAAALFVCQAQHVQCIGYTALTVYGCVSCCIETIGNKLSEQQLVQRHACGMIL
jgi:hypothetical protein